MVGRGPILHIHFSASTVLMCSALPVVLINRYTGALGKIRCFSWVHAWAKLYIYILQYKYCKATAAACVQEHCSGQVFVSTAGLMHKLLTCSCCGDCARESACCLACMHVHMHGMSCVRFSDYKSRVEGVNLFQYEMV